MDAARTAGGHRTPGSLPGGADPEAAWALIRASYRRRLLLPSLLAMTFATGMVDAATYLGIGGVFTANMTGNAVLFGFALAGQAGFSFWRTLLALALFALGSALAGRVARTWHHTPFLWFRRMTGIELVLLGIATLLMIGLPGGIETDGNPRRFVAIAILALAMGMRNATVRRLGFKDVPTTVVTSTISDLASDSRMGGGERRRQGTKAAAIAAMVLGAAAGALLVRTSTLLALGGAEAVLLATAAHQAWIAARVPRSTVIATVQASDPDDLPAA